MDNNQYFTTEQEEFIDTMQNGDIGEEIFECVTDGSLPYEDFELVDLYTNGTPEERKCYDRILCNLAGSTLSSLVNNAIQRKRG